MLRDAFAATAWLLLAVSQIAYADCECGYSVNKTSDSDSAVFTDLLENDFLHIDADNITEYGWRPQEYKVDSKASRGPFGKEFLVKNVETNPLKDDSKWSGEAEHGGDAGLELWIRGDHSHGYVSGSELVSVRDDCQYGSFRVGMKLSGENGTCGAFFYFFNNSQEIDLEFLSKQFNESGGAVNLVLQTPESVVHGYDASNTSEFRVQPLPFRPDEEFHEYRFDWTPEKVSFYVDGKWIYEMTENIPTEGGRLFLNHWSNGDPLWSAGPPEKDTPMTISYIKAYFNSTSEERHKVHQERCPNYDPNKVCAIPAQDKAPNGKNAQTYFFTQDGENKAQGQIIYDPENSASGVFGSSTSIFTFVPMVLAFVFCTFSL